MPPKFDNGLASVNAAYDRVLAAAKEAALAAILKDAEELAALQRRLAPKDTGALADSIHVAKPGEATPAFSQPGGSRVAGPNQAIVTVGDHEVRYAHLVEYGTAKIEAQSFFWSALRLLRPRFKRRDRSAVLRAVKKAWRR